MHKGLEGVEGPALRAGVDPVSEQHRSPSLTVLNQPLPAAGLANQAAGGAVTVAGPPGAAVPRAGAGPALA
jgi:hypothetical protein